MKRTGSLHGSARLFVVLSPENSGSSLVAAILGGSRRLIAPPELHLFRYADYETWRLREPKAIASLSWLMDALEMPAAEAELSDRFAGRSTHEVYRELLRLCGPSRVLVDKTPAYAREDAVLRRIEQLEPSYIWLVRHPLGVVASNLDRQAQRHARARRKARTLLGRWRVDRAHARKLRGGYVERRIEYWRDLNARVEAFLAEIPRERVSRLGYERLVRAPESEIRRLCSELSLEFEPAMLEPDKNVPSTLTWGLGSEKVALRSTIDAGAADRWRETLDERLLDEEVREMMRRLEVE